MNQVKCCQEYNKTGNLSKERRAGTQIKQERKKRRNRSKQKTSLAFEITEMSQSQSSIPSQSTIMDVGSSITVLD